MVTNMVKYSIYERNSFTIGLLYQKLVLSPHGREAPHPESPHDLDQSRANPDPEYLHPQARQELPGRQGAYQRLDRELERPLEGQVTRRLLNPSGHQGQWHEPPGEQEVEREVQLEN